MKNTIEALQNLIEMIEKFGGNIQRDQNGLEWSEIVEARKTLMNLKTQASQEDED